MDADVPRPAGSRGLRVVVEGVVIVLSILLAFTIEASWDERQDRREEAEILQALAVEFDRYHEAFSRRADFYDQAAERLVWLLDEAELTSSELGRLDEALLALVGAPTFEIGSGVHAELMASGRVSLITDPTLRRYVSTWEALLAETVDNEIVIREYATGVTVPYLASRHAPVGRASRIAKGSEWQLSVMSDTEALRAYRDLVDDPEFRALAAWRYEWALGSAEDFDIAATVADSASSLARASLGN